MSDRNNQIRHETPNNLLLNLCFLFTGYMGSPAINGSIRIEEQDEKLYGGDYGYMGSPSISWSNYI